MLPSRGPPPERTSCSKQRRTFVHRIGNGSPAPRASSTISASSPSPSVPTTNSSACGASSLLISRAPPHPPLGEGGPEVGLIDPAGRDPVGQQNGVPRLQIGGIGGAQFHPVHHQAQNPIRPVAEAVLGDVDRPGLPQPRAPDLPENMGITLNQRGAHNQGIADRRIHRNANVPAQLAGVSQGK